MAWQNWPSQGRRSGWASCVHADFPKQIELGRLYWPTGASRWAVGHYLVTSTDLSRIRAKAYKDNVFTALTLKISDEAGRDYIQTDLYMLPPRPLAQHEGEEQLYLLTLVDERFFWWNTAASITVTGGTTTWANLYSSIASALGVTISVDAVESAYLKPSTTLTSQYEYLPLLLDAVAVNTGRVIVRKLDGTITSQSPTNALASQTAQGEFWDKQGGGLFNLSNVRFHDFWSICPASVKVVFPRTDNGVLSSSRHVETVTLSSLALSIFPADFTGFASRTKSFHDETTATYAGGASPTNSAELTSLAQQVATDWYSWQAGRQDNNYAGIIPYIPDGLCDCITWTYRDDRVSTRAQRRPWNDLNEELNHYGTSGVLAECCALENTIWNIGTDTLSSNTDDYSIGDAITWLNLTLTQDVDLTGIEASTTNRVLFLYNSSAFALTLLHQSTSLTANQFFMANLTNLILQAGQYALLIYNVELGYWQVFSQEQCPLWVKIADLDTYDESVYKGKVYTPKSDLSFVEIGDCFIWPPNDETPVEGWYYLATPRDTFTRYAGTEDEETLPLFVPSVTQEQVTASKLLGRGSASGDGIKQEITLGTGLSMSGTTLNSTATVADAAYQVSGKINTSNQFLGSGIKIFDESIIIAENDYGLSGTGIEINCTDTAGGTLTIQPGSLSGNTFTPNTANISYILDSGDFEETRTQTNGSDTLDKTVRVQGQDWSGDSSRASGYTFAIFGENDISGSGSQIVIHHAILGYYIASIGADDGYLRTTFYFDVPTNTSGNTYPGPHRLAIYVNDPVSPELYEGDTGTFNGMEFYGGLMVDGSGASSGVDTSGTPTTGQYARFTDADTIEGVDDPISGESLTSVTVATDDKVLIQDTSDSDNLKTVTAQSIADLAGGDLSFASLVKYGLFSG